MMFTITAPWSSVPGPKIAIRCPHCNENGVFVNVGSDVKTTHNTFGLRHCPNQECLGHLFFVYNLGATQGKLAITYPASTIPFEKKNIPEKVLDAFREAIICHSNNCFIASAIMIRKTLEELCFNRGAIGGNLFQKLEALGKKVVIPQELIDGMHDLRLLGNDAAHIESETFNQVGKEEVEISIEFTKEILKAVYQYESLLNRIRGLKKSP